MSTAEETVKKPRKKPGPERRVSDEQLAEQKRAYAATRSRVASAIGRDIGDLPPIANEKRREDCRLNLRLYCETYLSAVFSLGWSPDHLEAIATLERVITQGGRFALAMARGSGKTSLVTAAVLWAICFGHRRYVAIISATAADAKKIIDSIKHTCETNDLLLADFPEIFHAIRKLEGNNTRANGQHFHGVRTRITWKGDQIVFPTIDGSAASGSAINSQGIGGSIRGMQRKAPDGSTIRPDCVLVDDPSTDESARSLAENARRERIVTATLAKLCGPNQVLAMLAAVTVIQANDLADRLLDNRRHPEMQGRKFGIMKSMPVRMDLWEEYKLRRAESFEQYGDISLATEFYSANRDEMDRGAVAAWDDRKEPHHLSAIQYAMDAWAENAEAFWSELMNQPMATSVASAETISAEQVAERYSGIPRGFVPDWAKHIVAAIDVQQHSLWWMVAAFDESLRPHIVDVGVFPEQGLSYVINNELRLTMMQHFGAPTFVDAIEIGLATLVPQLLKQEYLTQSGTPLRVEQIGIDANWDETSALVYQVARLSAGKVMPMHGRFVGATHSAFSSWRGEEGCKRGPCWMTQKGNKEQLHIMWDTNYVKSFLSGQMTAPSGGLSLCGDNSAMHAMLADNLTAEYGTLVEAKGRRVTQWQNRPGRDNHWLDCLCMATVMSSFLGGLLPGQEIKVEQPTQYIRASDMQRANRDQRRNERRRF